MTGMKKYLKRWLRKIKYLYYYGAKSVAKTVSSLGVTFKIILHPIKNGGIDIVIFNKGQWEPHVGKIFKTYIKPGDTVIDIGANIGYHSLFIASFLQDDCTVHSFEPQKNLAEQFKKSLALNNFTSVQIHNYGLANEETTKDIILHDENIGSSSLLEFTEENPLVVSGREKVIIKKMDTVFQDIETISFIKMDVEGYEYEVFLGAEQILRKHKPVILFEYSPFLYKSIDEKLPATILNFLNNLGYSFYDVEHDEVFTPSDDLFAFEQRDLLCIHKA